MFKHQQRAVLGFAALALAGLSGCAVVDSHHRVADWPELKVIEHHVSNREMRDRCAPYVGTFMSAQGCTLLLSLELPHELVLDSVKVVNPLMTGPALLLEKS